MEVHLRDRCSDRSPRLDTRAFDEERYVRSRWIDTGLAPEDPNAVITREHHDRPIRLPASFELGKRGTDKVVDVAHT